MWGAKAELGVFLWNPLYTHKMEHLSDTGQAGFTHHLTSLSPLTVGNSPWFKVFCKQIKKKHDSGFFVLLI